MVVEDLDGCGGHRRGDTPQLVHSHLHLNDRNSSTAERPYNAAASHFTPE